MNAANKKPKLLVIVGPTASGKTGLAIKLAKQFKGEVVSADSRQVYRGLDIGTAKVTREEMDGVPHHLIDVADVDTIYTAADFKRDATAAVEAILERGNLPIIAGGTFFYVDTFLGKVTTPHIKPNPELREELEQKDVAELHRRLTNKDPRRAAEIDPHNKRRLIRALEIIHDLEYVPPAEPLEPAYDVLTIGITTEKEVLREKFAARAQEWLSGGFQNEVTQLLKNGVSRERLQEIGFEYQLMLEYIDGNLTKETFVEKFIQKNWQYAKRQLTWLKRDNTIHWFEKDDPAIIATIKTWLEN
ncbi:MAG: tRNA (adenosine(37)-N6)-dimethylallyltransferase MiaA [Candidatus Paceibacterota bacterium]